MLISEPDEIEKFIEWLKTLTNEQRLAALDRIGRVFCLECGRVEAPERRCQCWNDE